MPNKSKAPGELLDSKLDLQGRIEVNNLSYRYSENDPYVFENLSFSIARGETVVIKGASGCGKSTLLKVMLGLLAPVAGDVRYDEKSILQLDKSTFRTQIAAVMQEDCLVAGSIAENIAFSDPQMDLQRVQAVAEMAAIHDEISKMPMAYNSWRYGHHPLWRPKTAHISGQGFVC